MEHSLTNIKFNNIKLFALFVLQIFQKSLLKAKKETNFMLIKVQQTQQYADIYSLQNYSTCFGCHNTHHHEY